MSESAEQVSTPPNVVSLLAEYDKRAKSSVDRALCSLLTRFQSELPTLNDYFHKAFRQCDCVDVEAGGYMDVAIHNLLSESELFWELFQKYKE